MESIFGNCSCDKKKQKKNRAGNIKEAHDAEKNEATIQVIMNNVMFSYI